MKAILVNRHCRTVVCEKVESWGYSSFLPGGIFWTLAQGGEPTEHCSLTELGSRDWNSGQLKPLEFIGRVSKVGVLPTQSPRDLPLCPLMSGWLLHSVCIGWDPMIQANDYQGAVSQQLPRFNKSGRFFTFRPKWKDFVNTQGIQQDPRESRP